MNWLYVGLPLAGLYVIWFTYLLSKKNYTRSLLFFALAHLPYLLVNVVAPFRGMMDADYAGYSFGWLQLPPGILVPLVVGGIVIGCLFFASRALLNRMDGLWKFALAFDLLLAILIALPVFLDILTHPADFRVELGEYLQVSGVGVSLVILAIFTAPTLYACYLAAKHSFQKLPSSVVD